MNTRLAAIIPLVIVTTTAAAPAHGGRHPASAKQVAAALANPARADQAVDDARRQPAKIIALTGAGPGSTVVDFYPGQGYWTRILTGVVGPTGKVYAVWPAAAAQRAEKPIAAINALGFKNVVAEILPGTEMTPPGPVDAVLTVQNYHDLANTPAGTAVIDAFNAQVFKSLKPGGNYVVVDHADSVGKGLAGTKTLHRIDPAVVKEQVLKAGFVLAGESDALSNPDDDHSKAVFDPSLRGHTDQFALRFRKPG